MIDFKAARINMVDSQINTMGVVDDAILDAFRTVPREEFVPADRKSIAYCDEDLAVSSGRCLMEPVTHARLLQAILPKKSESALDIGGATGYSAAILSRLCASVIAVEPDRDLLEAGESGWRAIAANNVTPQAGQFERGHDGGRTFDVIFVSGSVADIPTAWLDQLAPGGRMAVVVRRAEDRIGRAKLVTRAANGSVGERVLFEAAVPYLPGHEPRVEFVF